MRILISVPSALTPSPANLLPHQRTVNITFVSTASWNGQMWVYFFSRKYYLQLCDRFFITIQECKITSSREKCFSACFLFFSAQNANSCPIDRIAFNSIYLRKSYGGKVKKMVSVITYLPIQ